MNKTKKLTTMGLLGALSVLLVMWIHFPLFPIAPFLEYDPADIPIFLSAFLFGPLAGFVLTVVVSILQGFTVSSGAGIIGIIMHIFATGSFVLVAGNIYNRSKSNKGVIISLVFGTITMVVAMTVWNVLITPLFLNVPLSEVLKILVPAIIPFNIIKAGVNSIITLFLFKIVSKESFKQKK